MLVKILLELLVGVVDIKLFKPVHLQDGRKLFNFITVNSVALADQQVTLF